MTVTSITKQSQQNSGKTKFEEDLQTYFPDMYKFWMLMKFDPFYQQMMDGIFEMVNGNEYGTMEIVWQSGKINYINLKKQLTANKSHKK